MKIIYSAGNRYGAQEPLLGFLSACGSSHQIKIAGYYRSTSNLPCIDWSLDTFYLQRYVNPENSKPITGDELHKSLTSEYQLFKRDVQEYAPDLIISDGEPIVAKIAEELKISLWYCSSLLLMIGVEGNTEGSYSNLFSKYRPVLQSFPVADRYFIYSPFGDLDNAPVLKEGFEWISPYKSSYVSLETDKTGLVIFSQLSRLQQLQLILDNIVPRPLEINDREIYREALGMADWILTSGETQFVSDAIYSGLPLFLSPSPKDPETILNALWAERLKVGKNVGQIELIGQEGWELLENEINKAQKKDLIKPKNKTLDQYLNV